MRTRIPNARSSQPTRTRVRNQLFRSVMIAFLVQEQILDPDAEQTGQAEGQQDRRVVPSALERNDGLARDLDSVRELLLRPAPLSSMLFQPILHARPM